MSKLFRVFFSAALSFVLIFFTLSSLAFADEYTTEYTEMSEYNPLAALSWQNLQNLSGFDDSFATCTYMFNCIVNTRYSLPEIPSNAAVKSFDVRVRGFHPFIEMSGGALSAHLSKICGSPGNDSNLISFQNTKINSWLNLHITSTLNITGEDLNDKNYCIQIFAGNAKNGTWYIDDVQARATYSFSLPTPSPTPSGPQPFLDLPWDYSGTKKSFDEIVLDPNTWFDHEYPLQNVGCCILKVLTYAGKEIDDDYRSHSGYDYGKRHGIVLNTPVLAAAAGMASFVDASHSGGAGNLIKVDHGNGYQTWYEHLSKDDLIVSNPNSSEHIDKGDPVGKVGMTGNTNGPHIHLSVFKDENENGIFSDDYPFGFVDPLGWDGVTPDPWEERVVGERKGAKSYNLFIARESPVEKIILQSGGTLQTNRLKLTVPGGAYGTPLKYIFKNGPFENRSNLIKSIEPTLLLTATDTLNNEIHTFLLPIQIVYDYSHADLSNINENTLKIYYFDIGSQTWVEVPSLLDKNTKTISASTNHFSQFAIMGEVLDSDSPETNVIIHGENGQGTWYRSSVSVELLGHDNEGGSGLLYTLYSLNGEDWEEYTEPLNFGDEGEYTIMYQAFDNADNQEVQKTSRFHIDRTSPEVSLNVNRRTLWPPNGKLIDVLISGYASDENLYTKNFAFIDEYHLVEPEINDFGQRIKLQSSRKEDDMDGRTYSIQVRAEDLAGNTTVKDVTVNVPHDEGEK